MKTNKYYVDYCRDWHLFIVYDPGGTAINRFRNRDLANSYCNFLNNGKD